MNMNTLRRVALPLTALALPLGLTACGDIETDGPSACERLGAQQGQPITIDSSLGHDTYKADAEIISLGDDTLTISTRGMEFIMVGSQDVCQRFLDRDPEPLKFHDSKINPEVFGTSQSNECDVLLPNGDRKEFNDAHSDLEAMLSTGRPMRAIITSAKIKSYDANNDDYERRDVCRLVDLLNVPLE